MLSGMLMVRGEICGCTGFTGDSGASRFTFLPLDSAVNVILMLVLGNLNVHLRRKTEARNTAVTKLNTNGHCAGKLFYLHEQW